MLLSACRRERKAAMHPEMDVTWKDLRRDIELNRRSEWWVFYSIRPVLWRHGDVQKWKFLSIAEPQNFAILTWVLHGDFFEVFVDKLNANEALGACGLLQHELSHSKLQHHVLLVKKYPTYSSSLLHSYLPDWRSNQQQCQQQQGELWRRNLCNKQDEVKQPLIQMGPSLLSHCRTFA